MFFTPNSIQRLGWLSLLVVAFPSFALAQSRQPDCQEVLTGRRIVSRIITVPVRGKGALPVIAAERRNALSEGLMLTTSHSQNSGWRSSSQILVELRRDSASGETRIRIQRLMSDLERVIFNDGHRSIMLMTSVLEGRVADDGSFSLTADDEVLPYDWDQAPEKTNSQKAQTPWSLSQMWEPDDTGDVSTGQYSAKTHDPIDEPHTSSGLAISGRLAGETIVIEKFEYVREERIRSRIYNGKRATPMEVIRETGLGRVEADLSVDLASAGVARKTVDVDDLVDMSAPLGTESFGQSDYQHLAKGLTPTITTAMAMNDPRLFYASDLSITTQRINSNDDGSRRSVAAPLSQMMPNLTKVFDFQKGFDPRMFLFIARCAELSGPLPQFRTKADLQAEWARRRQRYRTYANRNGQDPTLYELHGLGPDAEIRFLATTPTAETHPISRIREFLKNTIPARMHLPGGNLVDFQPEWVAWVVRLAKSARVSPSDVLIALPSGKVVSLVEHPAFPESAIKRR